MEIRDMNELTRLTPPRGGGVKEKKRVGRGQASGTGKTAGRGGKGQKARTGNMNFIDLEGLGLAEVDLDKLVEVGLIKQRKGGLKILGDGELTKAVSVRAHRFSGSAKEKIEKAGGKAEVIVVAAKVTPQQRKAEEKKAAAAKKEELR